MPRIELLNGHLLHKYFLLTSFYNNTSARKPKNSQKMLLNAIVNILLNVSSPQ